MTRVDPEGRPHFVRVGKALIFVRDDGNAYLIERAWLDGARIAFACATVKAWFCYYLSAIIGHGQPGSLRWRMLPSVGDWAYRDDDGRLASLAHFINSDLYRREKRARSAAA